jgi:site-specific DNA recombinase
MTAAAKQPGGGHSTPKAAQPSGRRPTPPGTDHSTAEPASRRESPAPTLTVVLPPTPPAWTPEAAAIMLRIVRRAADQAMASNRSATVAALIAQAAIPAAMPTDERGPTMTHPSSLSSHPRFAFYGRVSTEDQQDPEASRQWQLARSRQLIEPYGGTIVVEYFDIDHSRSLPWRRRPKAAALLDAFKNPDRDFDAVVIGEPQRAFYGNQFGLTFPLFIHYQVPLWVPEVGGPVIPGSEAHDLVMSMYSAMSKGERTRIKIRVRAAMAAQAQHEGRFLGGRPPYGYRLIDAGPHPNPSKASIGQRLHRLEPDPATAPVVQRIFAAYLAGRGLYAIAEGLTRDGIPSPSAADPLRNPHRSGVAWSKSAIRAILANPRYTGYQVWNRQRRDEVLIDVDDVALGHQTKLRWNHRDHWIWSADLAHQPLIPKATFLAAQKQASHRSSQESPQRSPRRTPRPYLLRGRLRCGLCQRRMEGTWNHDAPHYRCRYPAEYALANTIEHPKAVYVRETLIVPRLDRWLCRQFDDDHLLATCQALAAATQPDPAASNAVEAARRTLRDCDAQLARYRVALDAGVDPTVVAGWIAETQARRAKAERALTTAGPATRSSASAIGALLGGLPDKVRMLAEAPPSEKAGLYRAFGVNLTYQPARNLVVVTADPEGVEAGVRKLCRRGDLNPHVLADTRPST